jgi:ankyrin repeat protein
MKYDTKDRNGSTCLSLAAVGGHAEVVGLLVEQDSTLLNIRDREGKTPFDLCAEFGTTKGHWVSAEKMLNCRTFVPLI